MSLLFETVGMFVCFIVAVLVALTFAIMALHGCASLEQRAESYGGLLPVSWTPS